MLFKRLFVMSGCTVRFAGRWVRSKWIERLTEVPTIFLRRGLIKICIFELNLLSLHPLKAAMFSICDWSLCYSPFCSRSRIQDYAVTK
ncbi:hypothetical protein AGR1C_pTi0131 [Agrobacterium fabacearum TT111]|nr:hypothetical protein AGR1C_pTi0131 [Agrobacterium fabacearum TT111]